MKIKPELEHVWIEHSYKTKILPYLSDHAIKITSKMLANQKE